MHAHVDTQSKDCDGTYVRTVVYDNFDNLDDYGFRTKVLGLVASVYASEATLKILDGGDLEYHEVTDEGYEHSFARFCEDEECLEGDTGSFRDLAAEAAGY